MQKKLFAFFLVVLCWCDVHAQAPTENVIIITFDGFRWQEMFGGADSVLLSNSSYTTDTAEARMKYWAPTPEERRKKLLPFIWTTIAAEGQIYGNRYHQNYVNVKNPYRISYPGYNEIFTGYPDSLISSNSKTANKNVTVLEFLNRQLLLNGKVASFASWDVFNFIFNEKRSGFMVNAGNEVLPVNSSRFALLNEMQQHAFRPFDEGIRPDLLTYYLAKEYLLVKKPRVLHIGFDDTDDWAHNEKYDYYLQSANLTDAYVADLWNTIQSLPEYKNKTTLILATDHGRGDEVKKEWTSHGKKIKGADQIWIAFLGKGIAAKGEATTTGQLYQTQLAQTIAQLLGYRFQTTSPAEESIPSLFPKKQ